jgi:MoxR-like ATPase
LHDAQYRRGLFNWFDYTEIDREMRIVRVRVPGIEETLCSQICGFMQWIREQDLYKRPGVAETIDWAEALLVLNVADLNPASIEATLGCILKYKGDMEKIQTKDLLPVLQRLMETAGPEQPAG